ncbi:hypothetical protein B0I35DRAFT_268011 [Stachybotrys elegans]|uniref:DUF676 domain-containing protein n=1 Tax=Stachybotrys elegans TaxID=80388 RepID=A0A8K0SRT8_9HYPO|nr:hypothetical protein B0I35DRAFT_268011 [Stachybotrys elegans]
MPSSDAYTTYRVSGLPPNVTFDQAKWILEAFFDSDGVATEPKVHSLGLDPFDFGRNVDMIATVTFSQTPAEFLEGDCWVREKVFTNEDDLVSLVLTIDTKFDGFTPINTVKDDEDHKIDCIVVSGLSSHPFGSWKQRGGHFMWLRDASTWRSPGVRVLLYGYDTSLVRSESFQDIDDIGQKLGDFITAIRHTRTGEINYEPRPLVFIAHSLGGLVVKEAICRLAHKDETNARCVYGLIFFGVPNLGIRTQHWLPMVDNQPNMNLVHNLEPGSLYLRSLHDRFCRVFTSPTSRVVSVYETVKSKTAKWDEGLGRWALNGPTEVLVPRDSAQGSCPPELNHNHSSLAMNQNHSDLPKFRGPHDSDYRLLARYLHNLWKNAVVDVQSRFGPEGYFPKGGVKLREGK